MSSPKNFSCPTCRKPLRRKNEPHDCLRYRSILRRKNAKRPDVIDPPPVDPAKKDEPPEEQDPTLEKHSLTLDAATKRKIVIYAPFEVTQADLTRIQKWLSFQLNIKGGQQTPQPEEPIFP